MEELAAYFPSAPAMADPVQQLFAPVSDPLIALLRSLVVPILPLDDSKLRLTTTLLAVYPLAVLYRFLPSKSAVHLYSIVIGLWCISFSLPRYSWIHLVVTSLVSWLLLALLPRHVGYRVVCVWAFGYLSLCHVWRMSVDYLGWTLDFTNMQLIATLKLCAAACNYADGQKAAAAAAKGKQQEAEEVATSGDDRPLMVSRLPSLLEFLGFMFFFPALQVGPAVELADYQAFASGAMFRVLPGKRAPANSCWPALARLASGLAAALVYLQATWLADSQWFRREAYLAQYTWWQLMGIFYVALFLQRHKYYFGWYLAEGATIMSGLGFNGFDSKGLRRWDRVANSHWSEVELAQSPREISVMWNKQTSLWIRHYVFDRVRGSESARMAAAFVVSAVWHGFYPGYFVTFALSAWVVLLSKWCRRTIRPYFMRSAVDARYPAKHLYDAVGFLYSAYVWTLCGFSFEMLGWRDTVQVFSHIWPATLLPLALTVLLPMLPDQSRRLRRGATSSSAADRKAAADAHSAERRGKVE